MSLQTYLRILRKRWRIIPVLAVICVGLAVLFTYLTPKTYSSRVQFFVSTSDSNGDNSQLAQGSTFTQARVVSYTQLLKTPAVLQPVIKQLNFPGTTSDLASKVSASVPPNTVLIDVAVSDRSPAEAQRIAAAIGNSFPGTVENLEKVSGSQSSPVKVTMVSPANFSSAAISPRPTMNIAFGLILGLFAGVGAALLRERLDTRIRSTDDVKSITTHTIVGGIPFDGDAPAHPLTVQGDPHSARAEAFRSLRTNLQFVNAAKHPRLISVTSSIAGEGKTTTSANLGMALAEAGSRVCLIEGDLRRPRLLEYLGMEGAVGLTDALIGRVDLADVIQPYGDTSLAVLGAGQLPPNPSELLGSTGMRDVLERLKSAFDYVIIDAPPTIPVTDAAVMSTLVDGTLIVVGASIATQDNLTASIDKLATVDAVILGVVVNRTPRSRHGYDSYRYYEYRSEGGSAEKSRTSRRLARK
ncbi:polysaccharide biosynthesis tyrosine autokinase [Rudaeicoccus suwonensis]|uniref:non-specific protein-tyrosine kinase n=1 Tax=Rudaeicoccus suwonensis TaxID=657409 RepID=A0A561E8S7_9MICO|nr:polysaccharide biosynthesis tyrosine autokinase [Rudaeicoccus suwonensis]TWE12022.1 capsular exopolysaccharide synthesis family protein [Rudaeicoccus suwonensis]